MPWMTSTAPNDFFTPRISTDAIASLPPKQDHDGFVPPFPRFVHPTQGFCKT